MHEYTTANGESVPEQVAEQFAHPDDWGLLDPESITVPDIGFDEAYHGINSGDLKEVFVDDRGNVYHEETFERVERFREAALPRWDRYCRNPFTYNDEPDFVSRDHFAEHVTRVIVIEEDSKFVLNSRSGVLWTDFENDRVSDEALELAVSLSETRVPHGTDNCEIERPERFTRALDGWHSSMEPSYQSEMINGLTSGEIDPAWTERESPQDSPTTAREQSDRAEDGESDIFPYAVRFGDTTNVCSQPASVWSTEELALKLKQAFSNTVSRPYYAGFS